MKGPKVYVVFGGNAVMIARDYEHAIRCCGQYFHGRKYIKGFYSFNEANEAATDYLWDIAPLDQCIPEKLVLNKIYVAHKLPHNE